MAIRQVGSRRIVVDGVAYRWRIPPKPTYRQECHQFAMLVFVWREDTPDAVMTFHGGLRPDAVYGPADVVTPRRMADSIRAVLDPAWDVDRPYEFPKACIAPNSSGIQSRSHGPCGVPGPADS